MNNEFFSELLSSLAQETTIEDAAKRFSKRLLLTHQPTRENVCDCLVRLKNSIGGEFAVIDRSDDRVVLEGNKCPFGSPVGRPELCRVTQTVFEDMARHCSPTATVEIKESIARGQGRCLIEILIL